MAAPDANPSRHVAFLKQSCGFSTQARNSTCCRKAIRTTNPATLAASARRVLVGPRGAVILALGCFIHALTIVVVCNQASETPMETPSAGADPFSPVHKKSQSKGRRSQWWASVFRVISSAGPTTSADRN